MQLPTSSPSRSREPWSLPEPALPKARLLRDNPAFRRLFLARSTSYVGDGVAMAALLLHIERTAGVGVAVSAFLISYSLPQLLGPIAGALADRVDQRTLMIGSDVGRFGLFVALAMTLPSFPFLLGIAVVDGSLATAFRPAGRSAIPALVERHELVTANAWLVTAMNVGMTAGPLLGGLLVLVLGVPGALMANAMTFLVSAVFLTRLPALPPDVTEVDQPSFFSTVREGLAFARRDRLMRAVLIGLVLGVAAGALDNVALVFMATRVFDAGPAGYGVLASSFGVGMVISTLLLVRRHSFAPTALFIAGWFGTAFGNFGVGLASVVPLAVVAQLIGGAGNGIGLVGGDTLIQEHVPRAMRGRAIGIAGTAPVIGMLIADASGGFLVDAFGARTTFLISGVATSVVALLIWRILKRADVASSATG